MSSEARRSKLTGKFLDRQYRESYCSSMTKGFIATQLVAMRGGLSQKEFGKLIGKSQSAVARMESPEYGRLTMATLLNIAKRLDIALVVRFVDHSEFLKAGVSEEALRPKPYSSLVEGPPSKPD